VASLVQCSQRGIELPLVVMLLRLYTTRTHSSQEQAVAAPAVFRVALFAFIPGALNKICQRVCVGAPHLQHLKMADQNRTQRLLGQLTSKQAVLCFYL